MSAKYKFRNPDGLYFATFAVVAWVDVFTRRIYRDILLESFEYCIKHKGLAIHAYVIMGNHVHLIISRKDGSVLLENIMRDMKKYSAYRLLKAWVSSSKFIYILFKIIQRFVKIPSHFKKTLRVTKFPFLGFRLGFLGFEKCDKIRHLLLKVSGQRTDISK